MTEIPNVSVGGILLAAGGSTRFGGRKQLFVYEGKTLLRRAAAAVADSRCSNTVVVIGSEDESLLGELEGLRVNPVINRHWGDGMSTSIYAGLDKLLEAQADLDAVLITLCDQPQITTEILNAFVDRFIDSRDEIIAARYNGILGVPALFSANRFDDLMGLEGDKGARDLIRSEEGTFAIDIPEAAFDIDRTEDAETGS